MMQNLIFTHPEDARESDYNAYVVSLSRKAKNHATYSLKPNNSNTNNKKPKKKVQQMKIQFHKKELQNGTFFDDIYKCRKTRDVNLFLSIQEQILSEAQSEPCFITACSERVYIKKEKKKKEEKRGKTFISLVDLLDSTQNAFAKINCPNSANMQLFQILDIAIDDGGTSDIDFVEQLQNYLKSIDRQLECLHHPACENFTPTALQRSVIEEIDQLHNVIIRSPTGTGKTMISLYMAQRTHNIDHLTVYIGPTKPICNEFSIFVYNQGLVPSICTEDFFLWSEIENAVKKSGVLICTPDVFYSILTFPTHCDFVPNIKSIIFDELPRMLSEHPTETSLLLMISTCLQWQQMVLSATMGDDIIKFLRELNDFSVVDSGNAIRPVDLLFHHYDPKTQNLVDIDTSATYSHSLLKREGEERLRIALRVPVSLDESKRISKRCKTTFNSYCNRVFGPKVLRGIDLTNIACELPLPQEHKNYKPCKTGKNDCKEVTDEDAEELYRFLLILRNKHLLPVMLFHSNPEVLNKYHKKCTALLEAEEDNSSKKQGKKSKSASSVLTGRRKPTLEDIQEESNATEYESSLFGKLEPDDLTQYFKFNKYYGTLGYAGRNVINSDFYSGIRKGLGIYHHGVEKHARDAVENGLRYGDLKVVFTDASLAFGLNLPAKTVVFLNDTNGNNELMSSDKAVQAAGRAGRWGHESSGHVIMYNSPVERFSCFWNNFRGIDSSFHADFKLLNLFVSTSNQLADIIPKLCNLRIPSWGWDEETSTEIFESWSSRLVELGFMDSKRRVTNAGCVALSLGMDAEAIFAGSCVDRFRELIENNIRNLVDFIFVVSHFLPSWRRYPRSHETVKQGDVNAELWDVMQHVLRDHETPEMKISSLYICFPKLNLKKYPATSLSECKSLFAHFYARVRSFHRFVPLPFGDQFLKDFQDYS